ncbi:MAG: tRNA pseudouridine(38-40) synthase TruA, partial [Desulfobacterales bacterium]|nr:tRNA pseudouridine(38-40) synthase TruA [Desulfobacterales bacterium]
MNNVKLLIEYDGTRFHGWQRQKTDRTIQEEIEKALETMTREKITLNGSGRTDAGVHALGQTANFRHGTRLTPDIFHKGLNSLLPDDIVIKSADPAPPSFHARFDVKSKKYRYRILNRPIPKAVGRHYAWFIRKKLSLGAMRSTLPHLIGSHDFKAFEGAGSPRSHTTRIVFDARLKEKDHGFLDFEIEANGFLRFMV